MAEESRRNKILRYAQDDVNLNSYDLFYVHETYKMVWLS